jgi:MoxR-like ATPase
MSVTGRKKIDKTRKPEDAGALGNERHLWWHDKGGNTMGTKNTTKTATAAERAQRCIKTLGAAFPERETPSQRVISGLATALVAGEHVLLLGPPGTGKSLLTRRFIDAMGLGGHHFEWLLDESTVPDALFGPYDLKAVLERSEFKRVTSSRLPTARTAFLDEIFKGNNVVRNGCL